MLSRRKILARIITSIHFIIKYLVCPYYSPVVFSTSGLSFDEYFSHYLSSKSNLLFFSYHYGWSVYIPGSDMARDRSIHDTSIAPSFNPMLCHIYVENNLIKFNALYITWVVTKATTRPINNFLCLMSYLFFIWSNQISYLESPDVIEYLLTEPSFLKEIHIV